MIRRRQVDKERAHQSGVSNSGHDDHQDPDQKQLLAGQEDPVLENFPGQGRKKGQPCENEKRRQREMASPKRCRIAIGIIKRRDGADGYGKHHPENNRP